MSDGNRSERSQSYLSGEEVHARWETDYLNPRIEPFYEDAFDLLVEMLGAGPGDSVLDAGCGYGFHASRLARRGLSVTGVDFSEAALGRAQHYLAQAGLGGQVELRQGNLLGLPFEDANFDYVSCWGVLMHIPEVERALEELVRVLRPGGRLVLAENNADSLHVRLWEPTLRSLKRLLGRQSPRLDQNERGREEWHDREGGGLLVRKTNIAWLVSTVDRLGASLVDRRAGQFSEIYTSLPSATLQSTVHAFNRWWFRRSGSPAAAMGNLLVFEKR